MVTVQLARHWYVIHTQTGLEERVKTALESRAVQHHLKEKISQIRSDVNARALRYQVYAEKIRKSNAVPPTFGSVTKEMKQS